MAPDTPPVLSAQGVAVEYPISGADGTVRAVRDFSIDIEPGEIVGIIGETGSGKSTAALAMLGLVRKPGKIVAGSIMCEEVSVLDAAPSELQRIRGGEISFVAQNARAALNPLKRIGDQIANVCRSHRDLSRKEAREEAIAALESVGISRAGQQWRSYPHELSGGMAQRAMIAMATVTRPKLVIADEPTTGLDVTIQVQILSLIRERVLAHGSAALIISHDLGVIAQFCDRALVMLHGTVIEQGTVDRLFLTPQQAYTRQLIASAPTLDWLRGFEGSVVSPVAEEGAQ